MGAHAGRRSSGIRRLAMPRLTQRAAVRSS